MEGYGLNIKNEPRPLRSEWSYITACSQGDTEHHNWNMERTLIGQIVVDAIP